MALVGSNGAGKTTLIRCLLGEYTCEGSVAVDGMDPRRHRQEVLSKVGFVPQLPPPLKMPVGQLIRFAASLCDGGFAHLLSVNKHYHRYKTKRPPVAFIAPLIVFPKVLTCLTRCE